MTLLFIGTTELLLISGIALLLFGGKKLPEMMRGLGKGVKEFKEGMNDITNPEAMPQEAEANEEDAETPQTKSQQQKADANQSTSAPVDGE